MPFSRNSVAVVTALNGDGVCFTITHHCVGAEVLWSQTCVLVSSVLKGHPRAGVIYFLGGVGFGIALVGVFSIFFAHCCGGVPVDLQGLGVAVDVSGSRGNAPH